MKYIPIIGLETHVELKTKSKMFCACSADYFGAKPNTHTCPVCLGLPGALPVPNKTAVEWCIKIALALNCQISAFSKFDRKNYFYPDLAKSYQISQYDLPFGISGSMILSSGNTVRIRRVHMEEDTGKLTHSSGASLIDFNRSSVPLVEIVTEPDFHNTEDVKEYLQKLQQIVRYLDVSNADMEKGDMRLEPNISLSVSEDILPNYKVEVKNINSFRFVDKAIQYEFKRQAEILENGDIPLQETRGYNESKGITVSQRIKEEANDYRYFPEPDIPPIIYSDSQITRLQKELPELPDTKRKRFIEEYELSEYAAEILTREKSTADYFDETAQTGKSAHISAKQIANMMINKKPDLKKITPKQLIKQIIEESQITHVDEKELDSIIKKILSENQKAVEDYKKGKENVIMFLLGQVMRQLGKKVDTQLVLRKIKENLQ